MMKKWLNVLILGGVLILCGLLTVPSLMASSIDQAIRKPLSERIESADEWYDTGNYRKARKEYELLARLGSKYGQYKLSVMHILGQSYDQDPVEAWAWAAVAAERNYGSLKKHADGIWSQLSEDQRMQAQSLFTERMKEYSDHSVTQRLYAFSSSRLNNERIGRGVLPESFISVSSPCYTPGGSTLGVAGGASNVDTSGGAAAGGIPGGGNGLAESGFGGGCINKDPNDNPMVRLDLLRMINYTTEQRLKGEHVTLGEFEVLEESDGSASPQANASGEEGDSGN
jgi:hypothetical protein